ncbi:MAG: Gldg family protein [Oscillospiraceae bacterium]|jgi:ABC-2 type transport system permease protein|nr:Gldg family protein [Oscillospiraceae bacterium]
MSAVFRRDFRAFFTSMTGFVFISVFLIIMNAFFVLYNILSASAVLTPVFATMLLIILFTVPILTMRVFSEEYKQGTDKLLFTAPVRPKDIVLGKFFACMGVFALTLAFTFLWVLIVAAFGTPIRAEVLGNYISVFCLAGVFVAVGMFVSSLTENQLIAAAGAYGAFFALYVLNIAAASLGESMPTWVTRAFTFLSVFSRYDTVSSGLLAFDDLVFFISACAMFLFFCALVLRRKRVGAVSAVAAGLAFAAFIGINIFAGSVTERLSLKADLTRDKIYALSDETGDILRDMHYPATIYMLASETDTREFTASTGLNFPEFLGQYVFLSGGNVRLEYLDAQISADVSGRFGVGDVTQGDIVVEGPRRNKHIPSSSYFQTETDYAAGIGTITGYTIEQELTGALLYVGAEIVPGAVFTTGHGEASTDVYSLSIYADMFAKNGFAAESRSIAVSGIPDGTDVVVIAAPQTDFSEEELSVLDGFALRGGSVVYLAAEERPERLMAWLASRGIQLGDFRVFDDVQRVSSSEYVVPAVQPHEMFASSMDTGILPLLAFPRGLTTDGDDTGVSPLLTTSGSSYGRALSSENTSPARAEDDLSGPFTVGAVSAYGGGEGSSLLVLPLSLSHDVMLSELVYLNTRLSGDTVRWLTPTGAASGLVIPAKALTSAVMNITGLPAIIISAALVFALPAAVFLSGLIFWLKRRRL